jgi:FkbM family methyltransferase
LNAIDNVTVRDVGLSDASGDATLVYDPLMPGAASSAAPVATQIRDFAATVTEVPMRVLTLDEDVERGGLPAPEFVKIDVEGMELSVIRGAERTLRRHRPDLYIELHGAEDADKRRNARDVASTLWDLGYRDILHVDKLQKLTPSTIGRPGHIYCRATADERRDVA